MQKNNTVGVTISDRRISATNIRVHERLASRVCYIEETLNYGRVGVERTSRCGASVLSRNIHQTMPERGNVISAPAPERLNSARTSDQPVKVLSLLRVSLPWHK